MAENITDYQKYVKVIMVKGEKGDPYDDTELRAELETILANNAYVVAIEDGAFQLPIHTINDNTIGSGSTWSSEKIVDTYPQVTYTISNNTITCDKTFNELREIADKTPKINVIYNLEYCEANSIRALNEELTNGFFISVETHNAHININHLPNDTINYNVVSDEDIKRIKFIDVETNDGDGEAHFTCPNRPHILSVVQKGGGTSDLIETLGNRVKIDSMSTITTGYPEVLLVDETTTTDNTYGLLVRSLTNHTYTVALAY